MRVTLPGFEIELAFHLDRLFVVQSTIDWKVELDTLSLIIGHPKYLSNALTAFISRIFLILSTLFLGTFFVHWNVDL